MIPKLPPKALREKLCDLATARSVFPFHGDNCDHPSPTTNSLNCYGTTARRILLQSKGKKEHDGRTYRQDHKRIHVGQARRLCLDELIDPCVDLLLGVRSTHPGIS